jgi:hypothetical protein
MKLLYSSSEISLRHSKKEKRISPPSSFLRKAGARSPIINEKQPTLARIQTLQYLRRSAVFAIHRETQDKANTVFGTTKRENAAGNLE